MDASDLDGFTSQSMIRAAAQYGFLLAAQIVVMMAGLLGVAQ